MDMDNPNARSYAIYIEHSIRRIFGCNDRSQIGGFTESDCIIDHPFWTMVSALTYLYGCGRICAETLENFYSTFEFAIDFSIEELLSFSSNTGSVNGRVYEIEYENGEKAMEAMKDAFSSICARI